MSIPVSSTAAIPAKHATRRSLGQVLSTLRRITRFDRALLAGAYAVLGGYLAGAPAIADAVIRAAVMIICIVCFANVVNDHADVAVDSILRPDRPIPSGDCSAGFAKALSIVLALASVAMALTISPTLAAVAVVMLALSGAYSWWFKSTLLLGNLIIALLVGATVVCGALAWGHVAAPVFTAAIMIAVYVLGQEVLFNLEDEAGDRASGVHTTAARLRAPRTLSLYRWLLSAFLGVAFVPALRHVASVAYLFAILVCVAIPILIQLALLAGPLHPEKIARAARLSRLIWVTGVVPLLLLRA